MIFLTGGAGYIASHTCVELLAAGQQVTLFDNFSNSHPEVLNRIHQITGKQPAFVQGDIRDKQALVTALRASGATAVIHFAGLKAVGESGMHPLKYYDNNVVGTVRLLEAMAECQVRQLVFSSSATVYGNPQFLPITEEHPLSTTNPYGASKLIIEGILRDLYKADPSWHIGILRYFNPVGAHPSGQIGENPNGIPSNLLPYIAQVAIGRREFLQIWGDDYPTPDGTGVRDYIHVVDLALGHIKALEHLRTQPQCFTANLGTGAGASVLETVKAFERASGRSVPYRVAARRAGDVASCYADPSQAHSLLGWRATRTLETACADAWRWQLANPDGFGSAD